MQRFIGILVFSLVLGACRKAPDFESVPEIFFNNISKQVRFSPLTFSKYDSITITIDFKDAEGDLGMDTEEIGQGNFVGEFAKNFHITFFKKVNGSYINIMDSGPEPLEYGGQFPRLAPNNEVAPIEGTLSYHFRLDHRLDETGQAFKKHDTLRFEVYIYDRKLQRSNTITTPSIVFRDEE